MMPVFHRIELDNKIESSRITYHMWEAKLEYLPSMRVKYLHYIIVVLLNTIYFKVQNKKRF